MDGSDIGALLMTVGTGLISLGAVGGGIALIVVMIRKSSKKSQQAEQMVNQMVQRLPLGQNKWSV